MTKMFVILTRVYSPQLCSLFVSKIGFEWASYEN
jgi:hypothetical protein